MLERTQVYVDTSYLLASFYNSWATGARAQLEIDLPAVVATLGDMIENQLGQPIQRQLWYDGIPDSGPHRYQRALRTCDGVQLRAGQLIEWGERRTQKAVDTRLVADMVVAGLRQQCTDIVLVSGDADMIPGVQEATAAGIRVHLYGFGWDSMSSALRHACDSTTILDPREEFAECMQLQVLEGPLPPNIPTKPIGDAEPIDEVGPTAVPGLVPQAPATTPADADAETTDAAATAAPAAEDAEAAASAQDADAPAAGAQEASTSPVATPADVAAAGQGTTGGTAAADTPEVGLPAPAPTPAPAPVRSPAVAGAQAADLGCTDEDEPRRVNVTAEATRVDVTTPAGSVRAEEESLRISISSTEPELPGKPDQPIAAPRAQDTISQDTKDEQARHLDEEQDTPPAQTKKPAPNPSMMAPRRKLRSRYVPLPNEVWASAGFQTPYDVGQQYATWWYTNAATPEQRDNAHMLSGGGLPPEVDRPLLQFACETLHEYTLNEQQRVALRDGFHSGIRAVLLHHRD
ncbi:NYN domain-containing protein [Corynebacterium sp. 13CS0277]|uniref:NYN domain-containing protein n=1 Tax=Corynebacterium sp. 13CS0277 TaxID=2071994 RepID=UPI000D023183|nr:NYN domain-containing protein [Corynebacterium sp. 13CS0277]PRQ11052.1 NYN domain-containing protein [Corynebacterium sp. 13CS0277]